MKNQLIGRDQHGSHWYWNVGWRCQENDKVCLPHSTFKRSIKIIAWTEPKFTKPKSTYKLRSRPWDDWRNADGVLYDHFIYGEVTQLETDGIHSICKDANGETVEVHSANLMKVVVRPSSTTTTTPRESKWGELKEYITAARKMCKDAGFPKPTDDMLRSAAEILSTSNPLNLFK